MSAAFQGKDAELRLACLQMLSHRVQGLALTGFVFLIVVVVLTVIQAAKHDWFIYKGTRSLFHIAGSCLCINQVHVVHVNVAASISILSSPSCVCL